MENGIKRGTEEGGSHDVSGKAGKSGLSNTCGIFKLLPSLRQPAAANQTKGGDRKEKWG